MEHWPEIEIFAFGKAKPPKCEMDTSRHVTFPPLCHVSIADWFVPFMKSSQCATWQKLDFDRTVHINQISIGRSILIYAFFAFIFCRFCFCGQKWPETSRNFSEQRLLPPTGHYRRVLPRYTIDGSIINARRQQYKRAKAAI